ncbi:PepSY domain-containing protein [Herbaspirillum autotrophicum]|uniref:PepSY domain-containing protein n=1 Tax=Herbaspirillum autotrophicum TaxID=180195 RepID=UPI00067E50EE|nr:sulfite reductase flavoprotein subunit alpha [Herbaspirillum autotrophicum]
MFKKIWFQIHWFIGITAGTILIAIGITGAILSFREEILDWINPGITHIAPRPEPVLTPQQLNERISVAVPHERILSLTVWAEPGASARVVFAPPKGVRRGEARYVDPYSGALLPPLAGNEFFEFSERLHRWLLLPVDAGKIVAGILALCLLTLALSGLYLRWPRRALDWRAWFKLDFGMRGRSFLWNLHSVIGTWALVMYVIFTTTGLYWAFDWFKQGVNTLAGEAVSARPPAPKKPKMPAAAEAAGVVDLKLSWEVFLREAGNYTTATLRIPDKAGQAVQINYLTPDASHERARNRMAVQPLSGKLTQNERFADKSTGGKFIGAIYPLHMGTYFGLPGRIVMLLASLMLPLFAVTGWMLYLDRRRQKRAVRKARALLDKSAGQTGHDDGSNAHDTMLLAWASQSGQAEQLALRSAAALQRAGMSVSLQSLATLDPDRLRHYQRVLFVVSTFGQGEPPDSAHRFMRLLEQQSGSGLAPLRYGILALGDRQYERFCGFGHLLDHSLQSQGAQTLFAMIEADRLDPAALGAWEQALGALSGGDVAMEKQRDDEHPFTDWTLQKRELLNAGSCGSGIYHLELTPPQDLPLRWQSGALAEILPRHAPDRIALLLQRAQLDGNQSVHFHGQQYTLAAALARSILPALSSGPHAAQAIADHLQALAPRTYSIASIPQDGRVHLLVRQAVHDDGPGVASGWLTAYATPGSSIAMRLLSNDNFALAGNDAPAILIGNGSGLAGLRSHLRARVRHNQTRNWLLFGERQRRHDFHYQSEIEQWQRDGMLERLDLAFSRDQTERIYVQDKLREAADVLRAWVADGAVIYICGSLNGMAAGVEAAITDILGAAALQDLIEQGRYRRDVY